MAIKFELIEPGQELWDYRSERAGNTTARRWGNWRVKILSVDRAKQTAIVSWNGNRPETYTRRKLERLRRKPGKVRDPWRI